MPAWPWRNWGQALADHLGKQKAAAAEAKKVNDQVFEKLKQDAVAAAKAVQDFNAKARGVGAEDAGLAANSAAMNPAIAAARAEMEAKRAALDLLQGQQDANEVTYGQQDRIDAAAAALGVAERAHADLLALQQAFEDRRNQIAMAASIGLENARRLADDQAERDREAKAKERTLKEKAELDRRYQGFYAHLDQVARAKEKKEAEEDKALEKRATVGQAAFDVRARRYERLRRSSAQTLGKRRWHGWRSGRTSQAPSPASARPSAPRPRHGLATSAE